MKKRKFWTTDKIVSIAAIFISFLTLFIFIRQTNIIERQSHLSVMPYLVVETSENSGNNTYAFELVNYGVGPAIIDYTRIGYKGKSFDLQLADFLEEQVQGMDSVLVTNWSTAFKGQAIRSGDALNVVTVGGDPKSYSEFLKVRDALIRGKFVYEIYYKSMYGHRWKVSAAIDATEQMPEALDD